MRTLSIYMCICRHDMHYVLSLFLPRKPTVAKPVSVPSLSGAVRTDRWSSGARSPGDRAPSSHLADSVSPVFVGADEDAALSALLAQQVVLTRHFLATQRRLHDMYRRALRHTQRQVYTHRDDLKVGVKGVWFVR